MSRTLVLTIVVIGVLILGAILLLGKSRENNSTKQKDNKTVGHISIEPTPAISTLDYLHTEGSFIVDFQGRPVILRGFVTVTHFDVGRDEIGYIDEDYKAMRAIGANYQSIRIFSATHDLAQLDRMVSLAKQNGMYSSFKLTMYDIPGIFNPRIREKIWGDFWRNTSGQQEKLIDTWKKIWQHYKDEPAIVGYDLLNEAEIGDLGVDPVAFERDYLIPFYRKAIDELRKIDTKHMVLIQPGFGSIDRGTGDIIFYLVNTAIQRSNVVYAPHFYINFIRHRNGIYFPERYKPLMDRYLNEAKIHNAPILLGEMGEFWVRENDSDSQKEATFRNVEDQQIDLFDSAMLGFSRPVFANDRSIAKGHNILKGSSDILSQSQERAIITDIMSRAYPQRTAGVLVSFSFDIQTKIFSFTYTPDSSRGTTEIFIPLQRHYANGFSLNHSSGITLIFDSQEPSGLKMASNSGGIDINRFSYNQETQILRISEGEEKGKAVVIEVMP